MSNTKTAKATWKGEDLEFHGELGSGYEFDMSSKPGAHGGSPMELLLAGVAGCTAVDVVSILKKKRQDVVGVTVEISGERAGDHPMVYTKAHLIYNIRGDVDDKAVEDAIRLSKTKYCSASIMFKNSGTDVTHEYRIEPA